MDLHKKIMPANQPPTIFLFIFFICAMYLCNAQQIKRVKHFGKNKGHLKMFLHSPYSIDKTKPSALVVVLHGCLQCASSAAAQTGWSKLADEYNFYVMYPQQRIINNPERCFKWYRNHHINKGKGENASIKQMIEYMKNNYVIDTTKIFITGLSAGAAMSVVMMADYPEVFNAGAIFAGAPYKVATNIFTYEMAFFGWRIKRPEKWAYYVRKQNPFYAGNYPRMIIYQGNNDWIVNKRNGVELMKQWTSLHGVSKIPTEIIPAYVNNQDIERNVYKTESGKDAVIFYKVNHLSHALLNDPGTCNYQGGKRGLFTKDKNYFSTLFTAYDFGIIPIPKIEGKSEVKPEEKNLSYQVEWHEKSTYEWVLPADCNNYKRTNSNIINLSWGNSSGGINVTETDSTGCKKQYPTIFVKIINK